MSQTKTRGVTKRSVIAVALVALLAVAVSACGRDDDSDSGTAAPGISDTEIKVGGSFPFSGPLAGFGEASKGLNAYFQKVNADGGVNGRKYTYKAVDDAYDPARGVTNARRLVEQDKVFSLAVFGAPALAVAPVAATSDTPLIALAGIDVLSDKEKYPTTRGWFPNNSAEAKIVAQRIVADNPDAKVGTVVLNNDAGVGYGDALAAELKASGTGAKRVKQAVYEPTASTLSSQVDQLKSAGADTVAFLAAGSPLIEGIKHIKQLGWSPQINVNESQSGILPIMSKTGSAGDGAWSEQFMKDPDDPQWDNDKAMQEYKADIEKYGEGADPADGVVLKGWALGKAYNTIIDSLGDDITAESFLKAWDTLPKTDIGVQYPGMTLQGGPDGRLIHQFQPTTFNGTSWKPDGSATTIEQ